MFELVENRTVVEFPKGDLGQLRDRLFGDVFLPGEEGYEDSKRAWNLMIEHQPKIVVIPRNEADVQVALKFAFDHGLPVGVQATGHGQPREVDGMLLVLSQLNRVEIRPEAKTAIIGGGTTWNDVIARSVAHGLIPISGSSPSVGVVGYTLGGGFGILSRKYGLAMDSVQSLRLVDPEGRILRASAHENGDLFWSLLGGGGSFGVVTEISIKLHDHPDFYGGSVMFDATLAKDIYPSFVKWAGTLPDEVSGSINMMTFPPVPFVPEPLHGRSMLVVAASALFGTAEAEQWLAPIRNLPGAEFDSFRPLTYAESGEVYRDPVDPLPHTGRGVLLENLTAESVLELIEAIGPANQSPNLMIQLRQLGGAIRSNHSNGSLTHRRQAGYLLYLLGVPMGPYSPQQMEEHAEEVFAKMSPYILSRGPLNWLGERNLKGEYVRNSYHREELDLLESVKQAIDPQNQFQYAGIGIRD